MDDVAEPTFAAGEEARSRHLEDDLRALVDGGLALARTEVALQKARASFAAGKLKWIAVLGVLAALLVFFSLVALTVGLVVALTPVLGALGATFAVFGGLVLVAAVCALLASRQWRRMVTALSNPEGS
jgi:hypothetical protein